MRPSFHIHLLAKRAEIVLEIVNFPSSIGLRVLRLMAEAARVTCAGLLPRRRIDAEFKPFAVDVGRERLHIRKLGVRVNDPVCIALALPGVVDVHVYVTSVAHAGAYHLVGRGAHIGVCHFASKVIPAIPTHRWRGC